MTETDRSDGFFLPSLPNLPLLVTPLCQHPAPPARPACPTAGTSRKPLRAATWRVRPPHPGASRVHTHCSCSRVRDPGTGTWRPLPPADGDTEVPGEAAGPPGGRRCRVRTPCRSPPARPCCGRCLGFSRGGGRVMAWHRAVLAPRGWGEGLDQEMGTVRLRFPGGPVGMETGWQQALPTTQAARLATQRGPGPSPADRPGTLAGHGRGKQSQGLYFRHFLTDSFVFEKITRVHRAGGGPVEPRGARPDPDACDDGRGRTANSGARRCERFLNQMQSRERDAINRRLCKFFFPSFWLSWRKQASLERGSV